MPRERWKEEGRRGEGQWRGGEWGGRWPQDRGQEEWGWSHRRGGRGEAGEREPMQRKGRLRSDENDLGGYKKGGLRLRSDAEEREGFSEGRGRGARGRSRRGGYGEEQRVRADLLGRHLTEGSRGGRGGGQKDLRAGDRGQREARSNPREFVENQRQPAEGQRKNRPRTGGREPGREEYGKVGRGSEGGREVGRGSDSDSCREDRRKRERKERSGSGHRDVKDHRLERKRLEKDPRQERRSREDMTRSSREDMTGSSREDMSRSDRSSEGGLDGSVRTGKRGLGEGSSRDERDYKGHKSSHGQLKAESNSRVVDQGKESAVNAGDVKKEDSLDAIWTDSSIGLAELEHCMKMLEWDKSKDNSREREKLKRQIEELKLSKLRQSQEARSPGPAAGSEEMDVNQPYLGPGKEMEKIQEKKRSNTSEAGGPEAVSAEVLLARLGQDQCSLLVRSFPDMDEYFGKFGTVAKISKVAHWAEVGRIEFVSRASAVRVLQAEHVRQGLHFYVEPGADKSRFRGHGSRERKRKTKSRSQEAPESLRAAGRVEGQEKYGARWRCRDCDHDNSSWARSTTAIAVRIYKMLPN